MSHIPSSAMKHAGTTHHDHGHAVADAARDRSSRKEHRAGLGIGAWVAIGGTLLAGAAAALAVPLLRAGRSATPGAQVRRKAAVRKGKVRKAPKGRTPQD